MQIVTLVTKVTPSDIPACMAVIEAERVAWNECSKDVFGLKRNSITDLNKTFYAKFRASQPETPSQIVISAQRSCLAAYRSVRSNKHKITEPCVKKGLSLKLDKRTYTWRGNGEFSMTTLGKRIVVTPHIYPRLAEYLSKYEPCDPRIFVRDGEAFVAYGFQIPTIVATGKVLGVDMGLRNFITTSAGDIIRDKEWLKRKRRARFLKRQLQQCGSRSAKKHIGKFRETRDTKDFCHRMANAVLNTEARVIVIEDLSKIKARKAHESKNRISQIPLRMFRDILSYKAPLRNKRVETVSPQYTSQIDHRTMRRSGKRMGRRYVGKDGTVLDADINAAINIAHRYVRESVNSKTNKHPVSTVSDVIIGKCLDGQARVNEPKRAITSPNVRIVEREFHGSDKPRSLLRGS